MNYKIKTLSLILLITVMGYNNSLAQVEITPMYGYNFDDQMDLSGGYAHISDGTPYGGTIGIKLPKKICVEVLFTQGKYDGDYDYYYNYASYNDRAIPITANYILAYANRVEELGKKEKVEAFLGLGMGAAWFVPENTDKETYSDQWFFTIGLQLGAKIWLSDLIGIRLQTNLLSPIQGAGVGIYAGTGGAGAGVSTYSSITQFGFMGGIIFRLKDKKDAAK